MAGTTHVLWPMPDGSDYVPFEEALRQAIARRCELHLLADVTQLRAPIILKENDIDVRIIGMTEHRTVITGDAHSIFQINGKRSLLSLAHVQLKHIMSDNDKRNIGAAVFVMGKCRCEITDCDIYSTEGFSVWCVQNARCFISESTVSATTRSAIVCFGSSALEVKHSRVFNCGQHGICLRGRCSLEIDDSDIVNCSVRALYAYEHARIVMRRCLIEGTQDPSHAAVELRAFGSRLDDFSDGLPAAVGSTSKNSVASLTATNVILIRNAGGAIRTAGNVSIALCESFSWNEGSEEALRLDIDDTLTPGGSLSLGADTLLTREESSTALMWEYHREDDQWIRYGTDVCLFLTRHYELMQTLKQFDQTTIITLPSPLEHYQIDLRNFEQINTISHFSRKIRYR